MGFPPPVRLFSDETLRKQRASERHWRENQGRKIADKIDEVMGAGIRIAGAISRANVRVSGASCYCHSDPHRQTTYRVAGKELEKVIALYETGAANQSQKRIAMDVIEDPSRIPTILSAVFENPAVEKYWRHHTKHHHDKALDKTTSGMLRQLVAAHFMNIPTVEDLRGKPTSFHR